MSVFFGKGHKVLCLSDTGAGNDEQGRSLENVYGTLRIAKGPGLPVSIVIKFSLFIV